MFVSHYCNVPYHFLDKTAKEAMDENGVYPTTLVEELYAASFHLIRNFELAPYAQNTELEDLIAQRIKDGKL